ncbi:hypothetical protein [Paracraurococcus lichenis]|uniref:Uncharacterized protein n=1 Tax=Paracraurococcus lichenis TaxID=3064888 RepID=A0ABT9E5L6_9PROT|nr:hypothetical protein [Paracraurococcus sp. LOR1-02]MDO9711434.1 hypothetical protein [Paracraurococcus sp. LOR1-02]
MSGRRALLGLLAGLPVAARAQQTPPLSEAQRLLFETPHLAALQLPLRLDYAFLREEAGHEPVRDSIRLRVTAGEEEGHRDITPEFLSGPRNIRYPQVHGFRGNPLLLFALDRDVRELSAATGGSTEWFRNHIRRALLDHAALSDTVVELAGRQVAAREVSLQPFGGEPRAGRFQAKRYQFVLSPEVPGWIDRIRTAVPEGGVVEEIAFLAAVPLGEATR